MCVDFDRCDYGHHDLIPHSKGQHISQIEPTTGKRMNPDLNPELTPNEDIPVPKVDFNVLFAKNIRGVSPNLVNTAATGPGSVLDDGTVSAGSVVRN